MFGLVETVLTQAVLANEYRKLISKEAEKERAKRANDIKYNHETSLSVNVSDKDETDTRKLAAEHMHVSEWKVREVQGIGEKAETEPMAKVVYEKLRSGDLEIHVN